VFSIRICRFAVSVLLTHLRVPADVVDFRAAVDRKIVMDRVVARAIVIVDRSAVGIAVRHNKVVVYMRHGRNKRRLPSRDRGDKRLPVPAINRAVVARFSAGLKEKVLTDVVPAAKACEKTAAVFQTQTVPHVCVSRACLGISQSQ
jgi:hypothetical protein